MPVPLFFSAGYRDFGVVIVNATHGMESAPIAAPMAEGDGARQGRWRGSADAVESPGRDAGSHNDSESRSAVGRDLTAGLTGALAAVPRGLATGALAGVNPVYGLYAATVAPITGALFSSTRLMVMTTTSAGALLAAAALRDMSADQRLQAIVLLTLLAGVIQLAAGLFRLGRITHFVSHSVMIGFLTAIAVLIVLSQLGTLVGYEPEQNHAVSKALVIVTHPRRWDPHAVAVGAIAGAIMLSAGRMRFGSLAALVAVALPSFLMMSAGWHDIQRVSDVGVIPTGLPKLAVPQLSALSWEVAGSAIAVAAVLLVQSAGVSETVMERGARPARLSRDFVAGGLANVSASLVRGIPVGGSLSATALSVAAGASGRWAAVSQGLWLVLIVLLFSGLAGDIAMPALAALLIVAAAQSIRPHEPLEIWRAGWPSRVALVGTFAATLIVPIATAVGIGVVLSAALHIARSATDVSIVELVPLPDGRVEEWPPPHRLRSNAVTVLQVYGSLFYAGARTFERELPAVDGTTHPVVVLRLRGHIKAGATFIHIVSGFAARLEEAGGRLYLSGVEPETLQRLEQVADIEEQVPQSIHPAERVIGRATREAYAEAMMWLVRHRGGSAGSNIESTHGDEPDSRPA